MKLSLHGTATIPDLRFRRYEPFSHRKSLKSPLPTSEIPKLLSLHIISLLSCSFILAPHLFFNSVSTFSLLYSFGDPFADMGANTALCSSVSNGTICCDRSNIRFDICVMKGDVRTHSTSSSIFLYTSRDKNDFVNYGDEEGDEVIQHEKIRPYTRKWEKGTMDTIDELDLIAKKEHSGVNHRCDVRHDVPAVFLCM